MAKRARIDQGTILVQAAVEPVAESAFDDTMIAAGDAGDLQQESDQSVAAEQHGDEYTYTEDDDEVMQPPPAKRARTGEQTM